MSTLWDRRYQRVEFRAPVQVARSDAQNENAVIGTALNLSEAGIFVTAPEPERVGTEVVCSVPLAGELRPLRGRVAWVRTSPRGMGIEFIDLSTDDSRVLRETVGQDEEDHPIKVWFDGLRDAIGAKAVLTADGIRLKATLPFLRVDSSVRFAPADRVEEVHLGTLREVRLAEGANRATVIEVEVGLTPPARGRVARPGTGWAPTDIVSGTAVRPSPEPDVTARIPATPRRRLVWAMRWIGLGLFIGGAALLSLELHSRSLITMPFLDVRVPAPSPALEPEPEPEPVSAPSQSPPRSITVTPGRLFLPVDGPLDDLERIRLGDPPGVVLNAPNASTPLAVGEHAIGQDAFRVLKVKVRPEGGIQLRVFFTHDPPATAVIEPVPGGLVVSIPAATTP